MNVISFGSSIRVQGSYESLIKVNEQLEKNSKCIHASLFCLRGFNPTKPNLKLDETKEELLFTNGIIDTIRRFILTKANTMPKYTEKEKANHLKLIKDAALLKAEDVLSAIKEGSFDYKQLCIKRK